MKFALVLSGGAARGAFHLGVLHFMEENSISIDAYSGSSIGSIIAVSHASGVRAKEQLKIFTSKDFQKIFKFNYLKNGIFRIDTDNHILNELVPIKKLEELPKKTFINAYDLKKKELHYFDYGDTDTLCMASSALIPIFKPISYKNMYLIDGGLFDHLPIKPFLDGNHFICSIDLMPRKEGVKTYSFNPIKNIKRKIFKEWIENANFSKIHSNKYITTQDLLNYKMFTFKELNELFNLGYKEAQKHFLDIL